ncbi:MAG: hypothetical protein LBO68_04490 [Synergistaceae bacterium]|jgi:hypothetical protein|nr:hypothetical protein [Synergistaceae bacterium]
MRSMKNGRKRLPLPAVVALILFLSAGAESAEVKFRVAPGAGVRAFGKTGGEYLQTAHFVPFNEYPLAKERDEGGYEVYSGTVEAERFHYIAGGGDSGFLKTARVVYLDAGESQKMMTVDVEKLEKLDSPRREDNGFKAADVYFNVNDAQHLVLETGETFRLIPIRVWQAMEGFTDNYFIEPDYKVEVFGDAGTIDSRWAGSPGLEYAELSALNPGVAVLRVTYGPILFEYGEGKSERYNAIDPVNTGIVVVTVVDKNKNSGKNSGIATNIKAREYDTIYFDKLKGDRAEYTFKPSGASGLTVRVHRPIHGDTEWGKGWSGGVEKPDGSFTVDLYEGRNVVEVSGGVFKEYHVINAKGVDINIENVTNPAWNRGNQWNPGDKLEISFKGIKTPLEKIAGIYNPGFPDTCYVRYDSPEGETRGEGVQYSLSESNAVALTVPESGKVELSNGVIHCGHMGDPLGSHRTRPGREPVYPNFGAKNISGVYSVLPDITLSPQSGDGSGDDQGESSGGGCHAGFLTGLGIIALLPFPRKNMKRWEQRRRGGQEKQDREARRELKWKK